jgi:hypothetical protein
MTDEDFNECLRRLGKEDADVNFLRTFKEVLERMYPDGRLLSKDGLLTARILDYALEGEHPSRPKGPTP